MQREKKNEKYSCLTADGKEFTVPCHVLQYCSSTVVIDTNPFVFYFQGRSIADECQLRGVQNRDASAARCG